MSKLFRSIARPPILTLGLFLWAASPRAADRGFGDTTEPGREKRIARSASSADPSILRENIIFDGDKTRCLVWEADSLPCVLDVEGFNRRVLTRRMFEGRNIGFVRTRILREALEAVFWARKGRETGIEAPASADEDPGDFLRFFNRSESRHAISRKEFPEDQLRKLYERHYRYRFMAAQEPALRLLGSTDRPFLERLRADLLAAPSPGKSRSPLADTRLQWVRSAASDLPEELASAADTLGPRGHALVSAPYGHFLVYVDSMVPLPEVPFEDAAGALRDLAIREDPDLENRAYLYWQNHRKEFLSPDTMLLAAWLNPAEAGPRAGKTLAATLSRQPNLVFPQTALPEPIRACLPDSPPPPGGMLGPLATPLGEWFFQVLSRKRGGRLLPFREVREPVKEKVIYPPVELYQSLEADLRLVKSQNSLALAVQQTLIDADRLDPQGGGSPRLAALQAEKDKWLGGLKAESFPMWPRGGNDAGSKALPDSRDDADR